MDITRFLEERQQGELEGHLAARGFSSPLEAYTWGKSDELHGDFPSFDEHPDTPVRVRPLIEHETTKRYALSDLLLSSLERGDGRIRQTPVYYALNYIADALAELVPKGNDAAAYVLGRGSGGLARLAHIYEEFSIPLQQRTATALSRQLDSAIAEHGATSTSSRDSRAELAKIAAELYAVLGTVNPFLGVLNPLPQAHLYAQANKMMRISGKDPGILALMDHGKWYAQTLTKIPSAKH